MSNVIPLQYNGMPIRFDLDGWLNATDIAKKLGKEPTQWIRQSETVEYMVKRSLSLGINSVSETELQDIRKLQSNSSLAKSKLLRLAKKTGMVKIIAGRNGGTWLHPKMAVRFARWLSVDFEIWCDEQIESILNSGVSLRQQLDDAIEAVERQKERGSNAGRELAKHRYKMPPLKSRRDCLLAQVQLNLEVTA
ncbi:KilA-N domain-containing protein [Halomonas venusta]|uniref:KilA-N domain-containing protein n=1 Tax=Vreelandella venusta TaxID=44935 RepID=UPI00295E83E0|nr:KilA-N domain-containing protein [Halomonas venusta]MDW0360810.1 KilA-N domain-containing protein [Halomonas venusta]